MLIWLADITGRLEVKRGAVGDTGEQLCDLHNSPSKSSSTFTVESRGWWQLEDQYLCGSLSHTANVYKLVSYIIKSSTNKFNNEPSFPEKISLDRIPTESCLRKLGYDRSRSDYGSNINPDTSAYLARVIPLVAKGKRARGSDVYHYASSPDQAA